MVPENRFIILGKIYLVYSKTICIDPLCVSVFVSSRYEVLFRDALPDERRQRELQDQIRRLILKKDSLNNRNTGTPAAGGSTVSRTSSGTSSGGRAKTTVPRTRPAPIVDPIRTLPRGGAGQETATSTPQVQGQLVPTSSLGPTTSVGVGAGQEAAPSSQQQTPYAAAGN